MLIRVEGGSDNVDKDFCMFWEFLRLFLAFLKHIRQYLAYFYPKQKNFFENTYSKIKKNKKYK